LVCTGAKTPEQIQRDVDSFNERLAVQEKLARETEEERKQRLQEERRLQEEQRRRQEEEQKKQHFQTIHGKDFVDYTDRILFQKHEHDGTSELELLRNQEVEYRVYRKAFGPVPGQDSQYSRHEFECIEVACYYGNWSRILQLSSPDEKYIVRVKVERKQIHEIGDGYYKSNSLGVVAKHEETFDFHCVPTVSEQLQLQGWQLCSAPVSKVNKVTVKLPPSKCSATHVVTVNPPPSKSSPTEGVTVDLAEPTRLPPFKCKCAIM
jgi:hypothetical protein